MFDAFASVAKALGHGLRAEIVDVLAQGERSVEDLAGEIGQSIASTSHRLQTLADVELLSRRRDGTRIYCQLASERVGQLWTELRDVAVEHVAQVEVLAETYLGERSGIELVTADELAERITKGRVVVLDASPRSEFDAAHVAGARSIPHEIPARFGELPHSREIIAYCRGPFCVHADEAVRLLQAHGYRARRLDEGFPEWHRAGLPIERSTTPATPAD